MSIVKKLKDLLASKEAKDLQKEVKKQSKKAAGQAKDLAGEAYIKTKEAATTVAGAAKEKVEQYRSKADSAEEQDKITFDEFLRVQVKVGTINSVEKIPKSDKLLRLMVNVGEETDRQIVSGIATFYDDAQTLVGRQAMFVTNLEPRTIFGHESNGMIFAVNDKDNFSVLEPDTSIKEGTRAS